jgi:hypothetical protein
LTRPCSTQILRYSVHFDLRLDAVICAHLEGKDDRPQADYITFAAEAGSYFVKHATRGGWNANLEEPYLKRIRELRQIFSDFDLGLTGIIFGKDTSHIYQLENGFYCILEGEADNTSHILHRVCRFT